MGFPARKFQLPPNYSDCKLNLGVVMNLSSIEISSFFGALGILLGGNIWFIRRLVLKIDKIDSAVTSRLPVHQTEIKNITEKISDLESEIKTLSIEIKHFGSIRERIAVIETLILKRKPSKRSLACQQ
jgi:cell division protein FtsB